MARAYLVIINDEEFQLYSTKAKAQKALTRAFNDSLKCEGVTAKAKREARKYWKVDKTSYMVDVEQDGMTYTLNGYYIQREIH